MKTIKYLVASFVVASFLSACNNPGNTFNFPVLPQEKTDGHDHGDDHVTGTFGDKISENGAISGADLLTRLNSSDSVAATLKAPIEQVCQMKGCWMTVSLGNDTFMRVTFKDYGFFVPKGAGGHEAVMQGVAFKQILSVETLRHYAEDEGKSKEEIAAITEPVTEYSFEAVGVIVR
jgi:hypothetical protein